MGFDRPASTQDIGFLSPDTDPKLIIARVVFSSITGRLKLIFAMEAASGNMASVNTIASKGTRQADIEAMVPAAVEALGGLDVLVNNAGIAGPTAPVETADPEKWEAVMTVDVVGTFHVTRLAIPHLKKSSAGSIIVMSSLGGRFGYPNRSAYCTAKMASVSPERSRRNWGAPTFASTRSLLAPSAANASREFSRAAPRQNTRRLKRRGRLR
jgi:NAD(P)-dependent dehydrogenase (short-subunit alcohol dehydrogenase family)